MAAYESFAEVYDLFMDNVPYDVWKENLLDILRQYKITEGLVAELGCGTGKMTRRLAEAGYDMIGIDNSYEMLGIAMEQPADGILYLCQDMRSFELYGTVAAVVSVCDSMNYIVEYADLVQVVRLVNNYLDPGGLFVFDLNTPYKYRTQLADNTFAENREQGSFIWENTFDETTGINEYDLTLYIRDEEEPAFFTRFEEVHYQRAYEIQEIKRALYEGGMELLAILDADTMTAVSDVTERIYVIARELGKKRITDERI